MTVCEANYTATDLLWLGGWNSKLKDLAAHFSQFFGVEICDLGFFSRYTSSAVVGCLTTTIHTDYNLLGIRKRRKSASPEVLDFEDLGKDLKDVEKRKRKEKLRREREQNQSNPEHDEPPIEQPWTISTPIGGRMINSDPVFSPDEKY